MIFPADLQGGHSLLSLIIHYTNWNYKDLLAKIGNAGAPAVYNCKRLHNLAHGGTLLHDMGFDLVPYVHTMTSL